MSSRVSSSSSFGGEAGSSLFPPPSPENFDPSSPRSDPVSFVQQREHSVVEAAIEVEKAKLLREKLTACYREEGVNHLENCKDLVEKYVKAFEGKSMHKININRDG